MGRHHTTQGLLNKKPAPGSTALPSRLPSFVAGAAGTPFTATGSHRHMVTVWDIHSARRLTRFGDFPDPLTGLHFATATAHRPHLLACTRTPEVHWTPL